MLVTLSGLPGSGTSTVARLAAARLGLDHLDGGTVFRALASERGLTLAEFAVLAEGDDAIDRALDDRLTERAADGSLLLESRLAGWLVHRAGLPAVKVWIDCEDEERAARVGGRDGLTLDAALRANRERETSERTRYRSFYGIDLADHSVYDLVLDSTRTGPADLVDAVVEATKSR